jgi:uncharacterized protein (TIGR02466 family)
MYELPNMEALNKEMVGTLVEESMSVPSKSVSNVGGWHSGYDLLTRPQSCFRELRDMVVECAHDTTQALAKQSGVRVPSMTSTTEMWGMVMRRGDYSIAHAHSNNHWAAVYYPDIGDADKITHPKSGVITFVDPRLGFLPVPGLGLAMANFEVTCKVGQLLVFPGWLMHYVHAYQGHRPRVSIACNVYLDTAGA